MDYVIIVFVFLFLILSIVILVKFAKKMSNKKQLLYKNFADSNGLTHSTEKHFLTLTNRVDGIIDGCTFRIYEEIVGSGKNQQVVANIHFIDCPLKFDFKIGKEHLLSKAKKLFGKDDIQLGNIELDKRFLFKSDSENEFRDVMTYQLQEDLKQLDRHLKAPIELTNGTLSYCVYGGLINEKAFKSAEHVIDFMRELINKKRRR